MPAATRGSQGITAPRLPFVPTTAPEQSRSSSTTTTKKKNSSTATAATKKLKSAAATAAAKASTTTGTEANTSKPRAGKTTAAVAGDKTTSGRVTKKAAAAPKGKKTATTTKKGAPKTVNKREPSLLDKVVGVKDKIVGTLEGKPGKKVRFRFVCLFLIYNISVRFCFVTLYPIPSCPVSLLLSPSTPNTATIPFRLIS